jgi:hypothetical protein
MVTYEPGSFDGIDATDGYHIDRDDGTYSGPEAIDTFTDTTMEPGEIWEFTIALNLSSEPDGPVVLEVLEDDGSTYIFQKTLPGFSGNYVELTFTVPTYEVLGEFSAPASGSANPEFRFQVVEDDSGNYWFYTEGVRLRSPIDQTANDKTADSVDSISSGSL